MGIPDGPYLSAAAQDAGPEELARLVLRANELARQLDLSLEKLPPRSDTPFLYGQLDDVLRRLSVQLRQLGHEERAKEEKGVFSRLFSSAKKARPAPVAGEARYDLEGNARTIPVTELVNFLSHSGKSGLLWVTAPSETFVLEFARGNLVHATTNNPPEPFRLGAILVREKMLTPTELDEAVAHARAADDLLGSFLVRGGKLSHAELQRVLTIQVQEMFHRLMDADNALYRFQDGAQLLRSQGLEVNITSLLLESARKKDELRQAEATRADELAVLSEGDPKPADASAPEAPLPEEPAAETEPSAHAESEPELSSPPS
jgi:hypothetical protein